MKYEQTTCVRCLFRKKKTFGEINYPKMQNDSRILSIKAIEHYEICNINDPHLLYFSQ